MANARNIIIIPIARPIPYTGVKSARVELIERSPADAAEPTVEIPAKTGITMKRTSSARAAYRGLVIISSLKPITSPIYLATLLNEIIMWI